MQKLNEISKRRGCDMVLPPNWPQDRFYEVIQEAKNLYTKHRYLDKGDQKRMLPAQVSKMIVHTAQFSIQLNHSEKNAILIENGSALRFKLCSLFPEVLAVQPLESVMGATTLEMDKGEGAEDLGEVRDEAAPDEGAGENAEAALPQSGEASRSGSASAAPQEAGHDTQPSASTVEPSAGASEASQPKAKKQRRNEAALAVPVPAELTAS